MAHTIQAHNLRGEGTTLTVKRDPDSCPICHRSIKPKFLFGIWISDYSLDLIFQCPDNDCLQGFIGSYASSPGSSAFRLVRTAPKTAKAEDFPDSIKKISPSFVKIYNQAITAEAHQLDQIAGVGLRKALEFLIKDYLIDQNSGDQEKVANIKKFPLGKCIKTFVEFEPLKRSAKLASLLGNDETHYTRVFEDKDIEHLKKLIRISVSWIESVIVGNELWDEMNKEKESPTKDDEKTEA